MKNIYLFSIIISSLPFIGHAQSETDDKDKVVFIEILKENPEDLSFLSLNIPLWHLAGSKINTSLLDLKGDISYNGKGKLNGGLNYKYGLGDKIAPDTYEFTENLSKGLVMSVNKAPHAQELQLYTTYFFAEKIEDVDETIKLKQVGNTNYVTSIKTKQLVRTGINLGYSQGFTWYNMNNVNISVEPVGFPNEQRDVSMESMSTIQDYKFLKLGICRTKGVNTKINAEGYGERSSAWMTISNFNLIYALQNDFDDVYVGTENTDGGGLVIELVEYSMNESNAKLPIGFEFTRKHLYKGSIMSVEYGVKYLPGLLKNINLMVNLGVSFNFDFFKKK